MKKSGLTSEKDIEEFFTSFNNHDWDAVFRYMGDECTWDASEKHLVGKEEIIKYWTTYHGAFQEHLGRPEKIVFGDHVVYLQVPIRLDFLEDGMFFGKQYQKGDMLEFACTDYYELDADRKIRSGTVFIRFFHP